MGRVSQTERIACVKARVEQFSIFKEKAKRAVRLRSNV